MLQQIRPDICIVSETFERENKRIESVLTRRHFKSISYNRKNSAIVLNENRFSVTKLDIAVPEEIESCWTLCVPNSPNNNHLKVRRIAVGSY